MRAGAAPPGGRRCSGRNAARDATRSPFVAKRGSSASAASPIAAQNRGHCRSEPTATTIWPSLVANVSYGTMFGWALPRRPGDSPVVNAFCAWLTRTASVDASSDTSTRWPRTGPVRATSQQRGQDPDRREQPAHDVADGHADLRRMPAVGVGVAGDRHQPRLGLDHEVVAGPFRRRPVRSVAADGEVDEVGVQLAQRRLRRTRAGPGSPGGSSRSGRRHRRGAGAGRRHRMPGAGRAGASACCG